MTVIDGPTWCLRLVTFILVLFSPPVLLILAFQPILFHTVVKRSFSKKVEQSCLTVVRQMTCQRSHMLVCIMLTPCFCFARYSRYSLLWSLKINFAWLGQRLVSLSFKKTTVHINLPEYYFRYSIFFSWDWCLRYPSLLTLFVIWHSCTTGFK